MKFIYLTDIHIKGKNPIRRIDNFTESVFTKLEEVLIIARENGAEFILCGGDIFDTSLVSLSLIDRFCDLIEKYGIRFITSYGNHDMTNGNKEYTALEHCIKRCKFIENLQMLEDSEAVVHLMDYTFDIDNDLKKDGYHFESGGRIKILVPHANITEKACPVGFSHVVADELKTNADYVLISHYHPSLGIKDINGTKFCWVGSLTRGTIDRSNIDKIPSVLLFDSSNEDEQMKIIQLKNYKPANEVFDLDKLELDTEKKMNLDDFIASLKEAKLVGHKFIDRLNAFCEKNATDKHIRNIIIKNMKEGCDE